MQSGRCDVIIGVGLALMRQTSSTRPSVRWPPSRPCRWGFSMCPGVECSIVQLPRTERSLWAQLSHLHRPHSLWPTSPLRLQLSTAACTYECSCQQLLTRASKATPTHAYSAIVTGLQYASVRYPCLRESAAARMCVCGALPAAALGSRKATQLLLCTSVLQQLPASARQKPSVLAHVLPGAAQDIKFNVHAHPTLSEVLDELFKQAHVEAPTKRPDPKPASMHRLPVAA